MKMKKLLMLIFIVGLSFGIINAADVDKSTYVYAVKGDSDTLRLDKYELRMPDGQNTEKRPVMMFAFGGGFSGGMRDYADYVTYFDFLARHGYVVMSIDYRTGLKDNKPTGVSDFAVKLQQSVAMAVEDLFTATSYIVNNSEDWKIDPTRIVVSGSSAGAITVLQAENMIANAHPMASFLPDGFNYAGVVSFAGAVCAAGIPEWNNPPCPMMMFHGDADNVVPFNMVAVENVAGLFGSKYISTQLSELKSPYYLYIVDGEGHSVASSPMKDNLYDILAFLREYVDGGCQRMTISEQKTPDTPDHYRTDFTLEEYILSNMPQ